MSLVLGPLLRYVGEREATVWVETRAPAEVEIGEAGSGRRLGGCRTFRLCGHHYAIVCLAGLEPGTATPYEVTIDGERVWPPAGDHPYPPSVIHTLHPERPIRLIFGSCRLSLPHEPPYNLPKDDDPRGREADALYALALRMRAEPAHTWPHLLLMLGDQVYADEVSPRTLEFIRARRDTSEPPHEEVADFEEYTRLYHESWQDPPIRWLLSTVGTAMIFDDHDLHDDWNTSAGWREEMRKEPWWDERIAGAFTSYWAYQHLGNLSPSELEEDEFYAEVQRAEDPEPHLRELALRAERESTGVRWSYWRDLGRTRLLVLDSRAGRVLEEGGRRMLDEAEWEWVVDRSRGDFDHLLIATSVPMLLSQGMHHLEAWNEAVCGGAWGRPAAALAERLRRTLDLEHWAAFGKSFAELTELFRKIATGEREPAPASIVVLSGDVHHAYLAEVGFPRGTGARSAVYQAVCSPMRNPLDGHERAALRAAASRGAARLTGALARLAGVDPPAIRWRMDRDLLFDNQIATLALDGRRAVFKIEKTVPGETGLYRSLERRLA